MGAPSSRRFVAGLIRLSLVVLAVILVGGYLKRRFTRSQPVRVQKEAPASETPAPGDLRIYSPDSAVGLVPPRDKIPPGLSAKTIPKGKGELETPAARDTHGI